jgi:hypothetical protein
VRAVTFFPYYAVQARSGRYALVDAPRRCENGKEGLLFVHRSFSRRAKSMLLLHRLLKDAWLELSRNEAACALMTETLLGERAFQGAFARFSGGYFSQ